MALHQYIGARYVPKIIGEWTANTLYEPLSIVIYNGSSYTSKQDVPANIGSPDNNPDYWACTGAYNAQVAQLNDDVNQLSDDVNDLSIKIAGQNYANRKYIFIGDSYNTALHYGGWGAGVISNLGLTEGVNAWNSGYPGGSFTAGDFLRLIQTIADTMSIETKKSITDVVIVGAVNDWNLSSGNISAAVSTLETYVYTTFPNAKEWIILGEWDYESDIVRNGVAQAYNLIQQANKRATIINKLYSIFLDPYFLENDAVHPTEGGMNYLVKGICNVLAGGDTLIPIYTDLSTVVTTDTTATIHGEILNGFVHAWCNDEYLTFSSAQNLTADYTTTGIVGTISGQNNLFSNTRDIQGTAFVYINGGASFKTTPVVFRIVANHNGTWTFQMVKRVINASESDYTISDVTAIRFSFDTILAPWNS